MTNKGDVERRLSIHLLREAGSLDTTENLAKQFDVSPRTIERDLKYLRENDIKWIEEVVSETLVSQYREIYNGYQTDIQKIEEIRNSNRKARDKEVEVNIIKIQSDLRKERLGLLMKGPAVWYLQKIQKSREIVTIPNEAPKAIFGEIQHNTHIDLEQAGLSYSPPTLEKDGGE